MKIALLSALLALLASDTNPKTRVKLLLDEEYVVEDPTDYPMFEEVLFELPIAESPTR